MTKKSLTLYTDEKIWYRFKELIRIHEGGMSASQKLEDYMKACISEYEGRQIDSPLEYEADYEDLKKRHIKLVTEADKLEKRLEKTGEFDNMADFVEKAGLDLKTYGNLTTMAPMMLEKWCGKGKMKEDMLIFLAYLELIKKKRQVEAKLEETIKAMAPKSMILKSEGEEP